MTYIVLARKWRPMTFEAVVGQEHVTRTLMNALKQNRIAHAYIFAGPRGVGKTTTARLLAKAVNCERQPTVNPCNECDHCQAATRGNSLDIIEIDGASNRGIDEIRNLRENIRFAPAAARYKVYIIDEVHMLSKEAFNALLKTLEEPPAHAIFIFATTEIHRVPLTILSRCQRFDFKRIPTALIAGQLEKIIQQENLKADKDALMLIARKAEGSMRDAISVMDQMISFSDGEITLALVQQSLGVINEEVYFEFTDLMQQQDDAKIIRFARQVYEQGYDLMHFLQGLEEHFRNLLVTRATGNSQLLETSDYIKKRYEEKAPQFNAGDLLHYLDILVQNESYLKFSPNPQLILELLLLKLAHKPLSVDLEELLKSIRENPGTPPPAASAPKSPGSAVQPPGVSEPKAPPSSSPPKTPPGSFRPPAGGTIKETPGKKFEGLNKSSLPTDTPGDEASEEESGSSDESQAVNRDVTEIAARWDQVLAAIKKDKIALASFLQDSIPYKLEKNILQIAFDPRTSFHKEHVQKNAGIIEKILKTQFQLPVRIECIYLDFEKEGVQKKVQTPEEILESMKSKEPVLQKLIDLFDCENLDE